MNEHVPTAHTGTPPRPKRNETMEENKHATAELTAERSLEIITQQIEQSRRDVSRRTGQSLFVAGLCTMGMAIVVAAVNLILFENGYGGLGHLLWLLLPAVIWLASRQSNKDHEPAPVSIIGKLVGKTWLTFAIFALGIFIVSTIWNSILVRSSTPDVFMANRITMGPIVILLMCMAVSITGWILKSGWLVWFGIIAGLLFSTGLYTGIGEGIIARLGTAKSVVMMQYVSPCISVFLIALVGLMLPGLMLKRNK